MGLTCALYRATDSEIDRLVDDPEGIDAFMESIEGPMPELRPVRPKGILGFLLRLTPITISEPVPDEEIGPPVHPDRVLDVEKSWHGLHFLLTGTADGGSEPACYLVTGGVELDDEGAFRALRSREARRFADHLAAIKPDELERRYDPSRMNALDIYPGQIWARSESPDGSPRKWLLESFGSLAAFANEAAKAGEGLVIRVG